MELKRITLDFKQFSNKMDIMTKRSFFEYFRIEELYNTLIGDQIYKYFAEKSVIDYNKFLSKIAILAKGSIEERIKLIFDIYDINGSGVLD